MSQIPLTTYQDMYEHILDAFDIVDAPGRPSRNARRAVMNAYRDLPRITRWNYFDRRIVLNTVASQTTGTIAYTNSSRTVTLTGATFPTNAKYYKIIISGVTYDIDAYVTSTTVTLGENSNPGADVAASTTYTLFRDTYELPNDFIRLRQVWDSEGNYRLRARTSDQQMTLGEVAYDTPGDPWFYTIMNSADRTSGMAIVFTPPPSSAEAFTILYEAAPRDLRIQEYSSGTVSTSGTAVTLTDGVFPTHCAGSVIRFSENTTKPTSLAGGLSEGDNQYYEERTILTRSSDTAAVIDSALTSDQSGVAYTVSDPIDFEPGAMLSAFQLMCESEYCRLAGLEKELGSRHAMAQQAVRRAIEFDARYGNVESAPDYNVLRRSSISTDS